jgi:hypothetical protein
LGICCTTGTANQTRAESVSSALIQSSLQKVQVPGLSCDFGETAAVHIIEFTIAKTTAFWLQQILVAVSAFRLDGMLSSDNTCGGHYDEGTRSISPMNIAWRMSVVGPRPK